LEGAEKENPIKINGFRTPLLFNGQKQPVEWFASGKWICDSGFAHSEGANAPHRNDAEIQHKN
jgi:hypothetical protein